MDSLRIIQSPVISEKSMNDASMGKYTFRVFVSAGKRDIKKIVEEKFKVDVVKISTITIKGRQKRGGVRRVESSQQPFKKAIVTVKQGQKIAMFDTGSAK